MQAVCMCSFVRLAEQVFMVTRCQGATYTAQLRCAHVTVTGAHIMANWYGEPAGQRGGRFEVSNHDGGYSRKHNDTHFGKVVAGVKGERKY